MSRQGFGGDDDDNKNDIERLLNGLSSAKSWYEDNKDLFERFASGGESVDLAGGEPISEAHVDEDKVLIVADVSGVDATQLELDFYDNRVEGKFGGRKFNVDVPSDVDEDSIEADMKNGVLRVELDREGDDGDTLDVTSVDHTDDTIGEEEEDEPEDMEELPEAEELEDLFDDDDSENNGDGGGEQ